VCGCTARNAFPTKQDLATGARHHIGPGMVYALDQHDRHVIRVAQDLRLVCVFNPALSGAETHDATGSFPPPAG
jgi:L-ectoine synthase